MKYKVGDRVRIKSIDWYNKHTNGTEVYCGAMPFMNYMTEFCNKIVTISNVNSKDECYEIEEDSTANGWTDEMIEGLVEEETLIERVDDNGLPFNEWLSHKGAFYIPDGYELKDENGNVINSQKIVLEKKKKYPKTYEECAEIIAELTGSDCNPKGCMGYMSVQLTALQKLLICRDTYWKIAGDEMGLGKPWEPSKDKMVYSIYRHSNEIETDIFSGESATFEFPTAKMRDAFYENFKGLIEECKELL